MNKLMAVLLALALVAPASAWTILGDNILGNNFDYVTLRSPNNGDSLVFNATTRKWEAGSGGGGSLSIQTDGVAQGTASTLNFSNGLSASGGTTGNVSPTYGTGANTITQGNDARHNVTPAAGVRGNIPVVNAAGTAYTSIDEGTATDQALMSLGANTPGAFRALIATDIDELLTVEQLVDVDITSLAANHMLVRDGSSKWVNAAWAGDVTGSLAANTWTTLIANDVVTNAKIRNSGGLSFIGRSTSTTGDPDDIDGTANQIPIVDSAGNTLDFRTISGDLTNVTGVFTIANQAVSPAKMADLAGLSLLGRSASTSGVMAALTGTANQIPIVNSGGTALAFTTLSGDVTNASGVVTIANDAVTFAKFQNVAAKSLVGNGTNASADATALTGSANQIPIINSSGTALAFTTVSGDLTNATGVFTIANDAVNAAKLAANSVDTSEIVGGAPGASGAEFADSVTNVTAATDLTVTATGDEIVAGDQLKLFGTTSDPTNEQDISYDTGDGIIQANVATGRVTIPSVILSATAVSSAITSTGDQVFSNGTSATLTAGGLNVLGRKIRVRASGTGTSSGGPSQFFFLKLGTVKIAQTATNTPSTTSDHWFVEMVTMVNATGASGTFISDSRRIYGGAAAATVETLNNGVTSGAVDLTAASALTFGINSGTTHSTTCNHLEIEYIK